MGDMSLGKPPVRRPEDFRGNIRPLSENAAQSVKQRMQPDFRRTAFCLFCHMSDEAEELKIIYIITFISFRLPLKMISCGAKLDGVIIDLAAYPP